MLKKIWDRIKSPVVLAQIVTNISGIIVLLVPSTTVIVDSIVASILVLINTFAGLNNPTDKNNF